MRLRSRLFACELSLAPRMSSPTTCLPAPGDLFIAAEVNEIDRLDAAKLLVPKSRCAVAANGLAVVGAKGATATRRHQGAERKTD